MFKMLNAKRNKKSNKGFTLVELIVVIAILMILAVVGVMSFGGIMDSANEANERADARNLAQQLNMFNAAVPESGRITTHAGIINESYAGITEFTETSIAVDTEEVDGFFIRFDGAMAFDDARHILGWLIFDRDTWVVADGHSDV